MRRTIRDGATWAFMILAAVGWFALMRPTTLGGDVGYIVVRGNSMEPSLASGDLVLTRPSSAPKVGDIVAYRVPADTVGAGMVVIHRVVEVTADGHLVLQGDNAPHLDPWSPGPGEVVGTMWVHVPFVGRVLAVLHDPVMLGALAASLVVPAVLLSPTRRRRISGLRPDSAVSRRRSQAPHGAP